MYLNIDLFNAMNVIKKKYFMSEVVELSVVIPCLNEVETLGICINKSLKSIEKLNVRDYCS